MTTSLSASTIRSEVYENSPPNHDESFDSVDELEKEITFSTQAVKRAYALVSAMATGPAIYQGLALISICLYLTYLGFSHRSTLYEEGNLMQVI